MKELQNRYKDDKQRQQQELMKFYKENQVNPLGSCLPLVAQLPVFISLFYMLRSTLRIDICPQTVCGTAHRPRGPSPRSHGPVRPEQRRRISVHPGSDEQGQWRRAGRSDRSIRGNPARVEPADVESDDGQDSAADHAVNAVALRIFMINFPAGVIVYWMTRTRGRSVSSTSCEDASGP